MKPSADSNLAPDEKSVRCPGRVNEHSPTGQPASATPDDTAFAFEEIAEAARFPEENPNPVFRVAADGRLLYANRASRVLLTAWGVAAGECLPQVWQQRIAGVLASGTAGKWDAPWAGRVLQLHCVPIVEGGYVNVYGSDVTERAALLAQFTEDQHRLAEQARIAEARAAELEATLDAISDGVVIYRHDGRIERENAAARLLGYQLSDRDLPMAERRARLRAELVNNPTAGVEQMPAARALQGETVRGELMRFCPTGGSDSAARYVLVSAAPICDRRGVSLGAVASLSDVTELRRARDELEQRVQERTAELEAIFASVPDALYVVNEQGFVRGNQAALDAFGANSVDELGEIAPLLGERMQARYADTGELIPPQDLVIARALRGERAVHEAVSRNPRTRQDQIHRIAAAPIVLNGEIVGAVGIATDITEQKLAQTQNARLLEELRASREQLRALTRRLVEAHESERSYVADQLYNQAGQVLAALHMQLARLGKAGEGQLPATELPVMQATLSEAIRELHDLASQLRPVGLDRSTLARVLEAYVTAFGKGHGLAVRFEAGDAEALRAPTDVVTAIFRAVEEGLTNIARHADATEVALSMSQAAGMLTVTLTDNGAGFDLLTASATGGLGLATIQERLKTIGGELTIASGRAGTCLRMQAPLDNEEHRT